MNDPVANQTLAADAVIVGGGLVGLSMAIALGGAGLAVAVVDREDPAGATNARFDGRATAIALASQRMLAAIGIWRHVSASQPILEIRVADGDSSFFLHYDHRDIGADPLGYMVENRVLRVALYARAAELPGVRLLAPVAVAAVDRGRPGIALGRGTVELADGRKIAAPIVIGADGRNSGLREAAAIRCVSHDYRQIGIVCTVRHELPHRGVAVERFLPSGPFAILPLTENRASLVWTEAAATAPALLALPPAAFAAELGRRFGDHLGALQVVGPRWSYPLSLHLAETYVAARLALIGDAAHVIHPVAGQGLNLGLRDVAALAEVLVDAARLGLDLGQGDVLERYQRWRRFDALALAAVTDGLTRLFSNDAAPLRLARRAGLAAVNALPPAKKFFMRHAMGQVGALPRLLTGNTL
jgi:2-octaprenyl-6-methoxyphenol hydroxylase